MDNLPSKHILSLTLNSIFLWNYWYYFLVSVLSKTKKAEQIWLNSSEISTDIWFLQYLVGRTPTFAQNLRKQVLRDLS